jgi:hypothetical protein
MKKLFITFMLLLFALPVFSQNVTQEWVARYNNGNSSDYATSFAVDSSGNVYVTGYSNGSGTEYDYATIKYNSSGVQQWVARYNGPTNYDDYPTSLAVDGSGNVYVTGASVARSWLYTDYVTIKYNSSGGQEWVANYSGPTPLSSVATSIAVDDLGNVYVTGYSANIGFYDDYATIKYNSSGVEQWVARYSGPANSTDVAYSIAVDGSGNVYVTGASWGINYDYATIKYNSSGVEQWVTRYNGPGNSEDAAHSLAVDDSGNVYVTGYSTGSGTGYDYATVKYNSSGVQQWVARYNGPVGGSTDYARSLAVDGSGNVYVTGESVGSGTGLDYATIKYNSSGVEQWIARYNGPGNGSDAAYFLAVDGSGNVYVTGRSVGSGTQSDYTTIKYNSSGDSVWVERYNGPGNNSDAATSLAVDGSGNVYVTGWSYGSGTNFDYATIKYSQGEVKRRPVFIVPGIAGTYAANTENDIGWIMTRGIHPDSTAIDPIGRFYDDIIKTLENEGYVQNIDLFVVNYDWRLPPGPVDNNIDGHISGLTSSGISNNNFNYAVDYLGWYMKKACEIWRQNHDEELDSIDIISHSTGGLVTRTYIQSDAYNGIYDNVNGYKLPRIKNFIMIGVPNRGASKAWNVLNDNWSGDIAYRLVLSKIINRAFQKIIKGETVTGPDGNITYESILDAQGKPDKKLFIFKYVPTARYLLATYSFIDFGSGITDVNNNPEIRNSIILDLNNGFDIDPLNDPNGFLDSADVTVLYGTGVPTASTSIQRNNFSFMVLQSFTQVVPWNSIPPNIWFEDISIPNHGDGTVPITSSANQFLIDPRADMVSFTEPDHTGLVGDVNVQTTILNTLDIDFEPGNISLGSSKDLKLAINILFKSVLLELGLNRPGYSTPHYKKSSNFTDDPDVLWFGNDSEGMIYVFDEVSQTIDIQLTGTGEDFYVMVNYNDTTLTDGIILEGYLDVGETLTYQFDVSEKEPMDVGVTSILSTSHGQILNRGGSVLSAYVTNFGSEPAENVFVSYTIDGKNFGPVKVPGSIAPNDSAIVTFEQAFRLRSQSDLLNSTLTVFTENPNDINVINDSLSINITLLSPITEFPYIENFNEAFSFTTSGAVSLWERVTGTNPSGIQNDTMFRSAFFSIISGESILRTPLIDLSSITNPVLSFYMSYTSNLLLNDDRLEVVVSTNGGVTFNTPLYAKSFSSQPSLATIPPQADEFSPGNSNQWRYLIFDLTTYTDQEIIIGFKATSAGGNNLLIDHLKIANADVFEQIAVNGSGLYGNLLNSGVQLNITGFSPLRTGNKTSLTPDASSGNLVISKVNDFPSNQSVQTNLTATTFSGAIFTPDVISDKYWDIAFTGDDHNSFATYDLIIDISSQLGTFDADRIYVLKRNSDNDEWQCQSTITEYDAGLPVKIVAQNQTGFGQFAFGTDDGTLPVDLIEFNATVDRNNVILNWTTAWELNNDRFEIFRKKLDDENTQWIKIGTIPGNGNTNEPVTYSFTDKNLTTGKYEYKLMQYDFNGMSTADWDLNPIVEIGIPHKFALEQNYPNPFNPITKIDFQIPVEGLVKLSVFDMAGREVATLVNEELTPGYYTYIFNGANFASGIYFYQMISGNVVMTKKAMLVK